MVVTHDLEEAIRLGDNIGILYNGELLKDNPTEDFLRNSNVEHGFLEGFTLEREMKIRLVFDILKQV